MMACAFETVGVTPSKVKGSAAKSIAVVMRALIAQPRGKENGSWKQKL